MAGAENGSINLQSPIRASLVVFGQEEGVCHIFAASSFPTVPFYNPTRPEFIIWI